jgi:O-glycosyl hydrolase
MRRFGAVALLMLAVATVLAVATDGSSPAPEAKIVVTSVAMVPVSAKAGDPIVVTGGVRNRASSAHAGRLTILLRGIRSSTGGRVIARASLARLADGRTTRFHIVARVPGGLDGRSYRLVACARAAGQRPSCRPAKGRLNVLAGPGSRTPAAADIPLGTVYQTIDGFGSSERVFDDPHVFDNFDPATARAATVMSRSQQDAVLDALYVKLGLTRVRPVIGENPPGIEPTNDNADPYATDPSAFNFGWKRLDAHAQYLARARSRGVRQSFLSPVFREPWMGTTTTNDVAEYAEWLLAIVRRCIEQGCGLTHISVANEPSYSRNPMSATFVRDVIKNLGPRLAEEGLDVKFVANDDVRSSAAAKQLRVILADPEARRYIGALATHLYDEPVSNLSAVVALGKRYGVPVWMTEFHRSSMHTARLGTAPLDWALLMHDLLATYDISAIDYMWGYFGEYDRGAASLMNLDNNGATYHGYTINKVYYYTGQYSRFVRPGAQRVSVASSDPRIRVTAYHRGSSRVLVAINPGPSPVHATLDAADLQGVSSMSTTRTSSSENWARLARVPLSGTKVRVTLPAKSVTTFAGVAKR